MPTETIRFGPFVLDQHTLELRKYGTLIRVPAQSIQILQMLLARPGELVTREELQNKLWSKASFGDFEHGLNAAVKRLRDTLSDSASKPKYVETLPRRGYRFIGLIERTEAKPEESSGILPVAEPMVPHESGRGVSPWRPVTTGVLLLLLAGALLWGYRRSRVPGATGQRGFSDISVVPFTTLKGQEVMPAFSPDGNQVVFAWNGGKVESKDQFDLYVKVIGSENISRLTSKPSAWLAPAWSPDGRTIAFARKSGSDSGIFEVSAIGGPERKIVSAVFTYEPPMSLSWSSDGRQLAYSDGDGAMHLLDLESGEQTNLPNHAGCERTWSPVFSPNAPRIAFYCEQNGLFFVFVMRSDGSAAEQVTHEDAGPQDLAWSADGKRVLLTNIRTNQLSEVDVESGKSSILVFTQDSYQPAVSPRGNRLAYSRSFINENIWATGLGPESHEAHRLLVSSTRAQRAPDVSPDGKRIAFESDRSGVQEIWVSNFDGSNPLQLSHFNDPLTGSPRWSPTGHLIAFDSRVGGQASVYVVDPDGGMPKKLGIPINNVSIPTWSRDGASIYLSSARVKQGEIYKVPVEGGEAKLVAKDQLLLTNAKESVDGKWLYFGKGDTNTEICLISSTGGSIHSLEGMPPVRDPTDWTLAKDGIYFVDQRPKTATIGFYQFSTRRIHKIVPLNKPSAAWGGLSLSPDGNWLVYSQVDDTPSDIMLVDHFQ